MFLPLFQAYPTGKIDDNVTIVCGKIKRTLPVYADCKQISKETPKKITVKNHTLKGLVEDASGITIEKGTWPADIDESGSRYIEFFVKGLKKSVIVRQVSFTLSGKSRLPRRRIERERFLSENRLGRKPTGRRRLATNHIAGKYNDKAK